MIGIYRFVNKKNGKSYVGLSNNVFRRRDEHYQKTTKQSRIPFDDILNNNIDLFDFEVLEKCKVEDLKDRETYWIEYYNSFKDGYNMTSGGDSHSIGENNGRSILTEDDVLKIRELYNNKNTPFKDVCLMFPQASRATLEGVWQGKTWSHISPEVFTKENKLYYSKKASNGEKSFNATLLDREVSEIRKRYEKETAKEIYEDYKDRLAFQTLQQILWGRRYKHLPIYKKKTKTWVYPK